MQTLSVASDVFLSKWVAESAEAQEDALAYNIGMYALLSIGSGLTVFVRTYVISASGFRACKLMFEKMTHSVLHAPMAWLDLNPSGRILNRFSDDMSKVDTNLPFAWGSVFACMFNLLGTFITVVVITKWLILGVIPVGYIYIQVMNKYLKASREIQRMQQMSISPVLTFMVEVSGG